MDVNRTQDVTIRLLSELLIILISGCYNTKI